MELLGHSMISTTLDVYAHVMPTLQRDAADKMDTLLRGGTRGSQQGNDD
jgi:integrase